MVLYQFARASQVALCVLTCFSHVRLYDAVDCSPPGSSVHGDSLGKNTGVGCCALLQGIFPTQRLNPRLWEPSRLAAPQPDGSAVKNPHAYASDMGSIPGSGRSPGGGNGNPLQYSCLGNPWCARVHGVTKSRARFIN